MVDCVIHWQGNTYDPPLVFLVMLDASPASASGGVNGLTAISRGENTGATPGRAVKGPDGQSTGKQTQ